MARRVDLFEEEPSESQGDLEALMEKMETILHIRTYQLGKGPWHARATGASGFGTGMTPVEAMRDALIVKRGER